MTAIDNREDTIKELVYYELDFTKWELQSALYEINHHWDWREQMMQLDFAQAETNIETIIFRLSQMY